MVERTHLYGSDPAKQVAVLELELRETDKAARALADDNAILAKTIASLTAERDALKAENDAIRKEWRAECDRHDAAAEEAERLGNQLAEVRLRRDRGLERNELLEQAVSWLRKRINVLENEAEEHAARHRNLYRAYEGRTKQMRDEKARAEAAEESLRRLRETIGPLMRGVCLNSDQSLTLTFQPKAVTILCRFLMGKALTASAKAEGAGDIRLEPRQVELEEQEDDG